MPQPSYNVIHLYRKKLVRSVHVYQHSPHWDFKSVAFEAFDFTRLSKLYLQKEKFWKQLENIGRPHRSYKKYRVNFYGHRVFVAKTNTAGREHNFFTKSKPFALDGGPVHALDWDYNLDDMQWMRDTAEQFRPTIPMVMRKSAGDFRDDRWIYFVQTDWEDPHGRDLLYCRKYEYYPPFVSAVKPERNRDAFYSWSQAAHSRTYLRDKTVPCSPEEHPEPYKEMLGPYGDDIELVEGF